ncbi:MAG: hypothetical protein AAF651_02405 [Cyanobacteria bacterium P01_C01_bin.73]
MWQTLQNFFSTLRAYPDLSPDVGLRNQVQRWLRSRPNLSLDQWYQQCWQNRVPPISKPLAQFLYIHLEKHTGLTPGQIRPSDRLIEDLKFPLICWFDWPIALCDDIYQRFEVDLLERFDESQLATVEDLARFLDYELAEVDPIPSQ